MKHLLLVFALAVAACTSSTPPPLSPEIVVCQYKVLDAYLGGNQELVRRVQSVGEGPFQLEELVDVLAELHRSDAQILDAGAAFLECLPKKTEPAADAGVVAPPPLYGNKVL